MSFSSLALRGALASPPDPTAVRELVFHCHRLALAHLRVQRTRSSLVRHLGMSSLEDLALDCIADLFERDETGQFVVLADYFGAVDASAVDPAGLQIDLRRLVCSKVNDALFRRHRDVDPELGRIIRNLKLAVRSHPTACIHRHRGSAWLFATKEAAAGLEHPSAPPSVLEGYLAAKVDETTQIPQVLEIFCAFTDDYPFYAGGYPLSRLAVLVRGAFSRLQIPRSDSVPPRAASSFHEGETLAVIDRIVNAVRHDMHDPYVGRGKVTAATFEAYLGAARDLLAAHFVDPDRKDASYFEALKGQIHDLTHEVYRSEHRHRFEYLMKKAKRRFLQVSRRVMT